MDKFTGLVGFSDAPEHQSPNEPTQENPMTLINHFYVGVNPDDLDGAWDTEGEALINFAKQFQEVAKQAEGNFLFVRRAPVLSGRAWFESGRVRWRMTGRFSIATLKKRQPLTDEEIKTTWSQLYCDMNQMKFAPEDRPQKETVGFLFARALEDMLKKKNA